MFSVRLFPGTSGFLEDRVQACHQSRAASAPSQLALPCPVGQLAEVCLRGVLRRIALMPMALWPTS